MKTKIIFTIALLFGFLIGIIFAGIVINISSGEMMVKELQSPYDFDKTVSIIQSRIDSMSGWHVTEIIDQNKECIENGGFPIGKFKIIKYCSGKYSAQLLVDDSRKKIGNMMPKTFAVYEKKDGRVYISTMNGAIMGKLFGGEIENIIEKVSLEVESMMQFVNLKFTLY